MVCQSGISALSGIPLFCARFELRVTRIMQRPYCLRSALRKVRIVLCAKMILPPAPFFFLGL